MTTGTGSHDPWDDARLATAFAVGASRAHRPADLTDSTIAAIGRVGRPAPLWRRGLAAAAAVVLAVGAVVVGSTLLGQDRVSSGLVEFRDGPSAKVRTLDARSFSFDYPADLLAYDSSAFGSFGSSIAVIANRPVDDRCGDERHVDINCVHERPLDPGEIRMTVGTGAFRGGSLLARPDIDNGGTTRLSIDGRLAILDDVEASGDDYYGADLSLHLSIEQPGGASSIVIIDLIARDPDAARARAIMQSVIETFRFDLAAFPSPSDWWAGRDALGLPVISVSDAIAVRDAGVDDREVAVHGWFAPMLDRTCQVPPIQPPFEPPPVTSPVGPACPDQFVWLTEAPEPLTTVEDDGFSERPPTGPAIHPDLDGLDGSWMPGLPDLGPAFPVEVAFVGHFDDRRSSFCPPANEDACRDRFVVDRVHWVNGEDRATSVVDMTGGMPRTTFDDVKALIDRLTTGAPLLSAVRVDGGDGLREIEPSLNVEEGVIQPHEAVWVVRVLEAGRAVTYIVVDGSDLVFLIDRDGAATQAGGPDPTPSPAPTPLPEPAFTLDLEAEAGPIVEMRVIDLAGTLSGARPASADDFRRPGWSGDLVASNLELDSS